jgi:quinol monooxygenase YgiN
MSEVIVVATFTAKPGMGDTVEVGLRDAILQTHHEQGCLLYALHRGTADPDALVFIERWTSAESLAEHAAQPWVTGLSALADLLTGPPRVEIFRALPAGDSVKGRL